MLTMLKAKAIGLILLALCLVVASTSCSSTNSKTYSTEEVKKLTIGYLPTYTAATAIVAAHDNDPSETGIELKLVPFQGAKELIAAVKSKQLDGTIMDTISTLHQANTQSAILTGIIRRSAPGNPTFAIYGPKGSSIADLRGKEVGTGLDTLIEYAFDKMLLKNGIQPQEVNKVNIPNIIVRMRVFFDGSINFIVSATVFNNQVLEKGKAIIYDDSEIEGIDAYLSFTPGKYDKMTFDSLRRIYDEAAKHLNDNPEKYRELLKSKIVVPEGTDVIEFLPKSEPMRSPDLNALGSMIKWLQERNEVDVGLNPEDTVDMSLWQK